MRLAKRLVQKVLSKFMTNSYQTLPKQKRTPVAYIVPERTGGIYDQDWGEGRNDDGTLRWIGE